MKAHRYLVAVVVASSSLYVNAMDLMEAWQATSQHDPQINVSNASLRVGDAKRAQAAALWRPSVTLTATAGVMNAQTDVVGAHFSAPGFGQSDGVGFATSVDGGNSSRWALTASQPLINPGKRAESRQLEIAADTTGFEWQAAQQDLMLKTAQRYFDVVLLESKLSLLISQQKAVDFALTEAKDRFALGDKPVTDTYEASARARTLQAQVLTVRNELELSKQALSDATGIAAPTVQILLMQSNVIPTDLLPLTDWVRIAEEKSPYLKMLTASVQAAQQGTTIFSTSSAATLDLIAQAGRDQLSGSGAYGSASNTASQQMVGLQLTVPIYTGGYRSAKLDEALRLQEKASAELDRAKQQIGQQIHATWLGIQTGSSRLEALSEALKASKSKLDSTRLGRQVGDRTTLDLLQAENDASSAELAVLQARIDIVLNRLLLNALSGQLDSQALATVNALLEIKSN